CARETPFAYW
nr:immunoglobulin heavy chain junction region [Mus musculus]MBK4195814.1 immunoglobulin heavy chain junction region [Mus musculus]MBK4195815.1 immunoglobulin heavy chain junction region [Mus musculus]